ncbi:MAG: hypothetical protein J2P59_03895, partial [Acidimicrobiales bacterium]|nr:hypothetical protein [Acidimicrobiales bacterium]
RSGPRPASSPPGAPPATAERPTLGVFRARARGAEGAGAEGAGAEGTGAEAAGPQGAGPHHAAGEDARREGRAIDPPAAAATRPSENEEPAGTPAAMGDGAGAPSSVRPSRSPELAPTRRWPTREELVMAWGDQVLAGLRGRAKAVYRSGRFMATEEGVAVFALPDDNMRSYCEGCRTDVEAALSAHLGVPLRLRLVTDPGPTAPPPEPAIEPLDELDLTGGPVESLSPADRLLQVFPGAEEL